MLNIQICLSILLILFYANYYFEDVIPLNKLDERVIIAMNLNFKREKYYAASYIVLRSHSRNLKSSVAKTCLV